MMGDAIRPHLYDAADGTAALPSYTFLNDRDTGFYRAAANQLGVALGGAAKLLYSAGTFAFQEATIISSTGAITINGTTAVVFNEDSADVDFRVETNGSANALVIDANTNNGFGNISLFTAGTDGGLIVVDPAAHTAGNASWARFRMPNTASTTVPTGGAIMATLWLTEPNLTLTDTLTDAATFYIANAPTEASNNYAIWVDSGVCRFDGDIGQTANRVPMIYTTSQTTTNAETVDSWGMTKQHITPYDDALAVLRGISVVAYEHKSTYDPSGRRKLGVLAESVTERMVTPFDEYVGIGQGPRLDMLGLAAINTRAIQQVDGEVEALRARVAFLEGRLKFLEVGHATDPD